MGFWDTEDGESLKNSTGSVEKGGGNFAVIPDNTSALAIIDEIKWDEYQQGSRLIKCRWGVLEPSTYKNRKVFQKLDVYSDNPKRAKKDKEMLAAMLKNAGSDLLQKDGEPTDLELATALVNEPMMIVIMEYHLTKDDGSKLDGNWVRAVAPKGSSSPPTPPTPAAEKPAAANNNFDDDIPF